MQTIWYILLAILGLSVLVITHELGHFLMGRWLGFTITEFSVGLGPKLFGIKGKQTEFTLRALPIGGSCRFYGEDQEIQDDRCFNAKPAWKRFFVVLAGPLMNILTAVVLSFVLLLAYGANGTYSQEEYLYVQEITPGGPAEKAGMETGDILLSVNGETFTDYYGFKAAIDKADVKGVTVTVLRGAEVKVSETKNGRVTENRTEVSGGEERILTVQNILDQETGNKLIKITIVRYPTWMTAETYNVWQAAYKAVPYTWDLAKSVYQSLWMIITGQAGFRDMAGIVGTVDYMSDAMAQAGSTSGTVSVFLVFMALIAVNLGIVNLLPLPALDGGRLIFLLLEMIRRKPVPPEKEGLVHLIGMIALLLLILALTISDIIRCFGG